MINSCVLKAQLMCLALLLSVATVYSQSPSPTPPNPTVKGVPAHVIEDATVTAGWRRYGFGARPNFSVILPEAPKLTAELVRTQISSTYISASSAEVYAAVRVDNIPLDMERATEEVRSNYFTDYFRGFAKGMESSGHSVQLLEKTKVTTAAGREGFQQRFAFGSMQGRAQMVFVGNSAFCVLAMWAPATPATDYESFFSSFRISTITP